jgi:hypothetical protein
MESSSHPPPLASKSSSPNTASPAPGKPEGDAVSALRTPDPRHICFTHRLRTPDRPTASGHWHETRGPAALGVAAVMRAGGAGAGAGKKPCAFGPARGRARSCAPLVTWARAGSRARVRREAAPPHPGPAARPEPPAEVARTGATVGRPVLPPSHPPSIHASPSLPLSFLPSFLLFVAAAHGREPLDILDLRAGAGGGVVHPPLFTTDARGRARGVDAGAELAGSLLRRTGPPTRTRLSVRRSVACSHRAVAEEPAPGANTS